MGNRASRSSKSSQSSSVESKEEEREGENPRKLEKTLDYLQVFQMSRKSYIDSWVGSMIRVLKRKAEEKSLWQRPCLRIVESLEGFSFGDLEKVMSVIEQIDSKEGLETKYSEINKKDTKSYPLRRAKTIKIDVNSFGKILKRRAKLRGQSLETVQTNTVKQTKDHLAYVFQHQFTQPYHPFLTIKQIFIESLLEKYSVYLVKEHTEQQQSHLVETLNQQLRGVLRLLSKGTVIYKECTMKLTGLKDKGYKRFMERILTNMLFNPPSDLHSIIYNVIKKSSRPYISKITAHLRQNVNISKFKIKKSLQIQGNYIHSLIMFSQIDHIKHPHLLLTFFDKLKIQIQNDIQLFNQTFNINEEVTIDGDSLLTILCFMLCKMKAKLDAIYAQLMVLHVVYGEDILTNFDTASYIVTAMLAALDYLQSEEFLEVMQ